MTGCTLQGCDGVVFNARAHQLERIAADVGRLRRRLCADDFSSHLLDRISGSVQTLDAIDWSTAADIYKANLYECGDEDESVQAALEDVHRRACELRRLLGEKAV